MDEQQLSYNPFAYYVTEPLLAVIGSPLRTVAYTVLRQDYLNFDLNAPNTSGGSQQIRLTFDSGILDINWDGITGLRDETMGYHITTRADSVRLIFPALSGMDWEASENANGLLLANESMVWKGKIGGRLCGVTVWGSETEIGLNPQAVAFRFPAGEVVVTIGLSSELPNRRGIGDGDELLIFSIEEWQRQEPIVYGLLSPIVPVWHASSDGTVAKK